MRQQLMGLLLATTLATGVTVAGPDVESSNASLSDCTAFLTYSTNTQKWTLTNSSLRKSVQLMPDGRFVQTELRNQVTERDLMPASATGAEFQIAKSSPRTDYRGDTPGWSLLANDCSVRDVDDDSSPDRADLRIRLGNGPFEVVANYRIWKGASLIEQWFEYKNVSSAAITVTDPLIGLHTAMATDIAAGQVDVTYFTGGEDTTTALAPQTFTPTTSTVKDLQTTSTGSRQYLPELILRNRVHNDGVLIGWSYTGGTFTRISGTGSVEIDAYGANGLSIGPGEVWKMATSHLMAFSGDLDDAGNTYKNFQYRYKWDVTNDAWVGAAKPYDFPSPWNPASGSMGNRSMFDLTRVYREMGATIWHLDAGWSGESGNLQATGNWVNGTNADLGSLGSYARENGMGYMVWLPPWDASPSSAVYANNPSWRTSTAVSSFCEWGGGSLRMDNAAAVSWMRNLLDAKTDEFGGQWIWRQDMGGISFDGSGINPVRASANYFELMNNFRADNPGSGINVNLCGGNLMSLETMRQSDFAQVTDGRPGQMSNWTPSFLYPQDKFWAAPLGMDQASIVGQLQHGLEWNGWTTTADPTATQLLTKYIGTMRFMKQIGLAGRWSQLYHPNVVNEDHRFFVQRMNRESTAGVIVPARDQYVASGVTVYPKGLLPTTTYVVKFQNSGFTASNTGAYWMANGITSTNWGGDLVWLNVTNFPGAGNDTTAPTAPTVHSPQASTVMGYTGVKVSWSASTDNTWVSHYEVLRNGVVVTKSASGRYAFVENGSVNDTYEVRAIDGDGNKSPLASGSAGRKSSTASSSFSPAQGGGGWRYESYDGSSFAPLGWNARHSQWQGSDYLTVGDNWQHPSSAADSARTWVSAGSGTAQLDPSQVFVTGDVDGPGGMTSGDGVRVKILRDGVQVWPASGWQSVPAVATVNVPALSVPVVPGTRISFIVNRNGNYGYDTTRWDPVVKWN